MRTIIAVTTSGGPKPISFASPESSVLSPSSTTRGLSRAEEHRLAALVLSGQRGDGDRLTGPRAIAARNELATGNLALVALIVKSYLGRGIEYDDLEQEGRLGLLDASEAFDPSRGRLSSLIGRCVRNRLNRLLDERGLVRVPGYIREGQRFRDQGKPIPARVRPDLLAAADVVLARGVEDVVDHHGRERLAAPEEAELDFLLDSGETFELTDLPRLLDVLDLRSRVVIGLRFGLDGTREHTLKEVGQVVHLTKERARQVERKALARLRRFAETFELRRGSSWGSARAGRP